MGFLTRSNGMSKQEARKILDLHELVEHSRRHGPVTLELYARIRRIPSDEVATWERNARRLVRQLRDLGYQAETEGDAERLTLFLADTALASKVRETIPEAERALGALDESACHRPSQEGIAEDRTAFRYGLRRLARRYNLSWRAVEKIVRSLERQGKSQPVEARASRIEERRSDAVIAQALAAKAKAGTGSYGRVSAAARILGCHRDTARAFLRRFDRLKKRRDR